MKELAKVRYGIYWAFFVAFVLLFFYQLASVIMFVVAGGSAGFLVFAPVFAIAIAVVVFYVLAFNAKAEFLGKRQEQSAGDYGLR